MEISKTIRSFKERIMTANPIILTEFGDTFTPEPSVTGESTLVGRHSCGGAMHLYTLSQKWQVLCCALCNFRMEVLHGIVRKPEVLRQHCAEKILAEKSREEDIEQQQLWQKPLK